MMKQTVTIIAGLCMMVMPGWLPAQDDPALDSLLPAAEALNGFENTDGVETYPGDELFYLINGGADLYFEYGFEKAVRAGYKNPEGNRLTIEIYEMSDPQAAYGIYSMQQMEDDIPDEIGDEGQIISNHAAFMKDRYVVKIHTDVPEPEEILEKVARSISSKIDVSGYKPLLILQLLPVKKTEFPVIKYFRGFLGLSNIYQLTRTNIYDFRNGIAGLYSNDPEMTVIILSYADQEHALIQYDKIANNMSSLDKYNDFHRQNTTLTCKDRKHHFVYGSVYEKYNFFIIYSGANNVAATIQEIRENIDLITM
ncbi:MAG: DUF6599 family protein [Bacteroidales bacterium]